MDHNPPIMNHNSRGRSTSSCNCGRKQAPREDPFDIQAANYEFYQVRIYSTWVLLRTTEGHRLSALSVFLHTAVKDSVRHKILREMSHSVADNSSFISSGSTLCAFRDFLIENCQKCL